MSLLVIQWKLIQAIQTWLPLRMALALPAEPDYFAIKGIFQIIVSEMNTLLLAMY